MLVEKINGLETSFYHDVAKDVLRNEGSITQFLNQLPFEKWEKNTKAFYSTHRRHHIKNAIVKQYEGLTIPPAVQENIDALLNEYTYTITTGQQIHIFLGPAFVMNKIWCCLDHCSKKNSEYPNHRFVPVFWMASEDHDFEEISSLKLYNKEFKWNSGQKGPVGRMNPNSLLEIVDQLEEILDNNPSNSKFISICRKAYASFDNFSQATRYILNELFGEDGLLILDPDHPELKILSKDLVIEDLIHNTVQVSLDEQIDKLKTIGIKAPINTRPVNHFYLDDNYRERLVKASDGFSTLDNRISFNADELTSSFDSLAEHMSPNAVLRPLYQQMILPNYMYVGGAGELMYWLELKKAFEKLTIPMPFFQIRSSAYVLPGKKMNKIKEGIANFQNEWYLLNDEEFGQIVGKSLNKKNEEELKLLDEAGEKVEQVFDTLNAERLQVNEKAHQKMQNRAMQSINELRSKYIDAQVKMNEDLNRRIQWKNKLFGSKQERDYALLEFWSRYDALHQEKLWQKQFTEGQKINVFIT
jgi:bacillithiol biosynthesis cysteine-adding enzyme BshC